MKTVLIPENLSKYKEISLSGIIGEKYIFVTNGLETPNSGEIGKFEPSGDEIDKNITIFGITEQLDIFTFDPEELSQNLSVEKLAKELNHPTHSKSPLFFNENKKILNIKIIKNFKSDLKNPRSGKNLKTSNSVSCYHLMFYTVEYQLYRVF